MKINKPKFFQSEISKNEDLQVTILIRFFYNTDLGYGRLIQNFIIFPKIGKYLQSATKIRSILTKNYINRLFIGDIHNENLTYEKTVNYDSLVFDVYYKINSDENLKDKIDNNKTLTVEVIIPKQYIIDEKEIGKCETCIFNYNCPYQKKRGKVCLEWEQV